MTVRLYRSTDASAPELSGSTSGSLLTILRACLVEGYGSRTSAGWTMPFSDLPNKKAAFKSVTGDYIQVDDNLDYRWASVLGFKTMSALDTGTEQYPNSDQIGGGYHYRAYKRYNANPEHDGWMVIASDNWFYFTNIHNASANTYPAGFFFGQYDCVNPSFTENNIITGYMSAISNASVSYTTYGLYVKSDWYVRRGYQNSLLPVDLHMHYANDAWVNPNPFSGSLELEKLPLRDDNFIRYGYLPNHFAVFGNTNMSYRGGELFEISAVKYVVLSCSSKSYAIQYDVDVG